MLVPPPEDGSDIELGKGPNITSLREFDELPSEIDGPVLLNVGDNISIDEIMPAGQRVLPYRSNIEAISALVFAQIDETYPDRARKVGASGSLVVAGENYGQGSSRDHAAIAPRYLGLRVVIARSFADIRLQNLFDFGILPLLFKNKVDYDAIDQGDEMVVKNVREAIQKGHDVEVYNKTKAATFQMTHSMSERQVEMMLAGSLINVMRKRHAAV